MVTQKQAERLRETEQKLRQAENEVRFDVDVLLILLQFFSVSL